MKRTILSLNVLFITFCSYIPAQEETTPKTTFSQPAQQTTLESTRTFGLNPSLVIRGDTSKPLPLDLEKCSIEVHVHGGVAETKTTLEFHNPSDDNHQEGRFLFPLPEGATVDGYALDISGRLLEGVVVEKERAKTVFKTIQQRGVDPGLMEWAGSNNFQSRVYPIDRNSSRTIQIKYVEKIDGPKFRIPLRFPERIKDFSLLIETDCPANIVADGKIGTMSFVKPRQRPFIFNRTILRLLI